MRLLIPCRRCSEQHPPQKSFCVSVPLQDHSLYEIECSSGHRTAVCLQNQKFELLFESGTLALADGYYREAVSSYTASFERFLEFFFRVVCESAEIPKDEVEETWKQIQNQSERQLGALISARLLKARAALNFDLTAYSSFRNKVIHKGYLPTLEETIQFGDNVLQWMAQQLIWLKQVDNDALMRIIISHMNDTYSVGKAGTLISSFTLPTIIIHNRRVDDLRALSLRQSLSAFEAINESGGSIVGT